MKPKKSLGQNFLTSEAAVWKIVRAAKITPGETVLEIGPGRGVLTRALLDAGAKVIAVEKDHELFGALTTEFAAQIAAGQLNIIEGNILEIEPGAKTAGLKMEELKSGQYKIAANIPYNITGQILKKFLSSTDQPSAMVVLLQKEVVERIIAADKKESILSISVKAYGHPKKITVVNRGSFFPAPNVDSAVIAIENISKNNFVGDEAGTNATAPENAPLSEDKFFELVRAGFAHKRKMLVSNLEAVTERPKILAAFAACDISEKIRAEDLELADWLHLTEKI